MSASGAVGLRSCRPLRIADNGYDVVCFEIVGVVVTITDEKASVSLYMLKGLRFTLYPPPRRRYGILTLKVQ